MLMILSIVNNKQRILALSSRLQTLINKLTTTDTDPAKHGVQGATSGTTRRVLCCVCGVSAEGWRSTGCVDT